MSNLKILLVEDDVNLGSLLKQYLSAKKFTVDLEVNGDNGFKAFRKNQYDICILDIMMPQKDGFTLAQEIRTLNSDIPIIFLTARDMQEDVLEGFKIGADDYITKPFNMQELIFRIEAIIRRSGSKAQANQVIFKLGKFNFDSNQQSLVAGEDKIHLTTKESELLKLLCQHENEVLERDLALNKIWMDDNYFNARSMDVYITKLRKHLSSEPSIEIINIHGKGYKLINKTKAQ